MKNIAIILFIILSTSFISKAQLRVNNDGKVGVATVTPVESFQIGDRWTFYNGSSKLIGYNHDYDGNSKRIFNDEASAINLDSYGNINFQVASAGAIGSTITWKVPMKINNDGSIFFDLTNNALQDIYMEEGAIFRPAVKSNGHLGTSDKYWYVTRTKHLYRYTEGTQTLKSDGSEKFTIEDPLSLIKDLNTVGFIPADKVREMDKSDEKGTIGFAGADVNKVLPQLVEYNETTEEYGIDYDGIIPILVEAIKQQQSQIVALNEKIESFEKNATHIQKLSGLGTLHIYPNPIEDNANIHVNIPESAKSASLKIVNSSGKLIQTIMLEEKGQTEILFNASGLSSGLYVFSLIVDNNVLTSNKMLIE